MDTLFFILSKIVWALIKPESWILILLTFAVYFMWRRRIALAMALILMTLSLMIALGSLPLGSVLQSRLEAHYPAAPELPGIAGIIVLGGAEDGIRKGLPNFNEAGERFVEALVLARAHPEARLVFSGGSGRLQHLMKPKAAGVHVSELFFERHGLDMERFTLEAQSRNTAENALYSYDLIQPEPNEVWVLITSAWHMPRAMRSFERAGWSNVIAWPVDFRASGFRDAIGWDLSGKLQKLNSALKEYVGQFYYDIRGI